MRIAIFGTGGVGGYFGGRFDQAGHSVAFLARGAHLEAIRRDGLAVESVEGDFVVRPAEATDEPSTVGQVDVVLVCVKAWQVPESAAAMVPMLGPDTLVVPLENGVEAADQLAAVCGDRVLGGLCRIMSYVAGPGRIRHAGIAPEILVGERGRARSKRVETLRAALQGAVGVRVEVRDDIDVATWEKFLFIASFSGVGAVTRMPVGAFRSVPESREMLVASMREVWQVARARGIALPDDAVERTMTAVDSFPAGTTSSMQRDLFGGRPSELDHQTGAVVRLARAHGVAAPVNAFIYASLLPSELRARGMRGSP